MEQLKIVRRLIDKLNEAKILYCHWKSNQHVSDAFIGVDDIDMLVSQKDILKLNIILNELEYKRFRLPEQRSYIGIEDYLGFDIETGKFVHLHLHYQLTLGEKFLKGYQLPYSESILKRRVFDEENKIYITSHEDEMWLLLLRSALKLRNRDLIKSIIKRDIFGASIKKEFEWIKKRIELEFFKDISSKLFGDLISRQMVDIVREGINYTNIKKLSNTISRKCAPFKSFSVIKGTFVRWSREFFRVRQVFHNKVYKGLKLYRRSPVSGGKIISFLGPDGAGKSTIIKEVIKRLQEVMDVNNFYLGSGDGQTSLLRKPLKTLYFFLLKLRILDRKSKKIDEMGKTTRVGESKKSDLVRTFGQLPWIYTLSRERKKKIIKARKFRSKGYVVITDRYPQTQFVDICDGPRYFKNNFAESKKAINKLLTRIERKSFEIAEIVKPDLVIILKVTPEIAYKRKPDEIDINSHKNLMNLILSIEFGDDTERIIIDADQEFDKVILGVLAAIWRCL